MEPKSTTITLDYLYKKDATITFYNQNNGNDAIGLFSGFGQTVATHNVLKAIFDWAIDERYQIVIVETFINDIKTCAQKTKYEYNDFQKLIDMILGIIPAMTHNYPHIIAHSTPTIPIAKNFSNSIQTKQAVLAKSATFFAPFPTNSNILDSLQRGTRDEDIKKQITNIKTFAEKLFTVEIDPTLMGKYKFPFGLVAGKKDTTAPAQHTTELVTEAANPYITQRVVNENHNFSRIASNEIIEIVKTQIERTREN